MNESVTRWDSLSVKQQAEIPGQGSEKCLCCIPKNMRSGEQGCFGIEVRN